MSAALQGSCQVPLAVHSVIDGTQLHLEGLVGTPDGRTLLRAEASGTDPEDTGQALADDLARQGAMEIIAALESQGH